MRNRKIQISLRLTENEKELLERNAKRCGLGSSEYIRMLIKGYIPKELPPDTFLKLCGEIKTLNELLIKDGKAECAETLRNIFLELKASVLLPEKFQI